MAEEKPEVVRTRFKSKEDPKKRNAPKIAYCIQCKPPVVIAGGYFGDNPPAQHPAKGAVHTQIKFMAVDQTDLMRPYETPQMFLDRVTKDFKSQLV